MPRGAPYHAYPPPVLPAFTLLCHTFRQMRVRGICEVFLALKPVLSSASFRFPPAPPRGLPNLLTCPDFPDALSLCWFPSCAPLIRLLIRCRGFCHGTASPAAPLPLQHLLRLLCPFCAAGLSRCFGGRRAVLRCAAHPPGEGPSGYPPCQLTRPDLKPPVSRETPLIIPLHTLAILSNPEARAC